MSDFDEDVINIIKKFNYFIYWLIYYMLKFRQSYNLRKI